MCGHKTWPGLHIYNKNIGQPHSTTTQPNKATNTSSYQSLYDLSSLWLKFAEATETRLKSAKDCGHVVSFSQSVLKLNIHNPLCTIKELSITTSISPLHIGREAIPLIILSKNI